MLQHQIDEHNGILTVAPIGELSAVDFKQLTDTVDTYNAQHKPLNKLLILTEQFPGWDSFGALFQHLKFVREHRDGIVKVAAVTDSGFLTVMPHIIDHFIKADVRHFAFSKKEDALVWLLS